MGQAINKQLEQLPIPLLTWYHEHKRDLPWRSDPTPYHVWVSEIMLQQTRVQAVLGYYERFLNTCPTVADLAQLPEDRLMKLWQGLGYYNRSRSLQKAAKIITEEYAGVFPADYHAIRALPGIGDYTAGAISSIAFGIPVPAVDGNVLRVVARITGDDTDITTAAMKRKVADELSQIIPVKTPGDFNQALMELGATVCLPNGAPLCEHCPAAPFCEAYRTERTDRLPVKKAAKERRLEQREVFLCFFDNKVAIRRRAERGLLAGLWEFPNELSPAPCPLEGDLRRAGAGKHIFSHVEWHMTVHTLHAETDTLPEGWVWASRKELDNIYAIPNAFDCCRPLLEQSLSYR